MDKYIFISYAHKDSEQVQPVINTMQKNGFRIWYDEGIDPGSEFGKNIAKRINECSYFVAFISNAYLNSSYCNDEINFARDLEKKLFLVYIEDVELPLELKMRLSRIQNIYKHKYEDETVFYQKLFAADGIEACRENSDTEQVGTTGPETSHLQKTAVSQEALFIPRKAVVYPRKRRMPNWLKVLIGLLLIALIVGGLVLLLTKNNNNSDAKPTGTGTPTPEPTATSTPTPIATVTSTPIPQEDDNTAAEELFIWEVNENGNITIVGINGTPDWELKIPNIIEGKKVTEIGVKAFAECKDIVKVTIPEGVTKIGARAFSQCENLIAVELPESLISIGELAFAWCISLNMIELPAKLETLGNSALFCSGIGSTVTIPASVRNIEAGVFSLCYSLEAIHVEEGNVNYESVDGVLFDEELKIVYCYPARKSAEEYEIPYGVEIIEVAAFNGAKFGNVVIPETVTTIQTDAFMNCYNLSVLRIPKSVAVMGCLYDPIPMEIAEENPYFKSEDKFLLSKDGKVLHAAYRDATDTTYRVPGGVEVVGSLSFYGLGNVKEIILPESVIEIENEAFPGCTALEKIYVPETVTRLYKDSFSGIEADCKIIVKAGSYAELFAISQGIPVQTE